MDRVRDLVAAGGVSVVLAQDRDRFAREPAYHYLLRQEFEEHGTKIRALNDRGGDSGGPGYRARDHRAYQQLVAALRVQRIGVYDHCGHPPPSKTVHTAPPAFEAILLRMEIQDDILLRMDQRFVAPEVG
jgi:hypothetical protein